MAGQLVAMALAEAGFQRGDIAKAGKKIGKGAQKKNAQKRTSNTKAMTPLGPAGLTLRALVARGVLRDASEENAQDETCDAQSTVEGTQPIEAAEGGGDGEEWEDDDGWESAPLEALSSGLRIAHGVDDACLRYVLAGDECGTEDEDRLETLELWAALLHEVLHCTNSLLSIISFRS